MMVRNGCIGTRVSAGKCGNTDQVIGLTRATVERTSFIFTLHTARRQLHELTSSSAAAERPREPLSQLKSRQLLHNCTKNHI